MDSSRSPHFSTPIVSICFYALLLLGAATGVFLAGKAEEGAPGIFLAVAGVLLLICPPQIRIRKTYWLLLAAFLFCGLLGLSPQEWSSVPPWRMHLQKFAVPLGNYLSPVPGETAFYLAMIGISGVLLLFGRAHPLRSNELLGLATAGAVLSAIYSGLAIYAERTGWKYPFDGAGTFGFFLNRNHAATFLVTGSILSLGVLGVAGKTRRWLCGTAAALSLAVNGAGLLVYSASRGGIVFLVAGSLLWLLGLGRARISKPLVISFAAIFTLVMTLFLVSGGEARNRLLQHLHMEQKGDTAGRFQSASPDLLMDARILIYRDTWRMIQEQPLTGVGLGAFRYVYQFYRESSLTEDTSEHPESDWLMVAAEQGIPAVLILLAGGVYLFRGLSTQRTKPSWPLRWGVACAALAAIGHGIVDVPSHRTALGFWILVLVMAVLQGDFKDEEKPPLWQRLVYWLTGLGALGMGIFLIRAEWYGGPHSPPEKGARALQAIHEVVKKDQLEKAVELVTTAIAESPMTESLYYLKGSVQLHFEGTEKEVDELYAAERALQPDWPFLTFRQGADWMGIDPVRTEALWRDALERKRRIDRANTWRKKGDLALFGNMLERSTKYPEVQRRLYAIATPDADMILAWLQRVPANLAAEQIPLLSRDDVFLKNIKIPQRNLYLKTWYEKGDRAALWAFAEEHSDWKEAIWPLQIRRLVDAKNFQEAVQATLEHYHLDLTLPNPGDGKKLSIPEDGDSPHHNFDYFWKAGNAITARRIIEEARVKAEKSGLRSPEIWKKSAALAIHEGRWDVAWSHLQRYLQESKLE